MVQLQGRGQKQVWALVRALVPALALGWAQAPASAAPLPQPLQSSLQRMACLSQLSSSDWTVSCGWECVACAAQRSLRDRGARGGHQDRRQ